MGDRPSQGDLFVISAPSGAGKTTLIRNLFAHSDFGDTLRYSVSHTTRARRPGEVDGKDYHFVDEEAFRRMIDQDGFLEWALVHGQLKGTSVAPVLEALAAGIDVLMDVDVQGAASVRARYPAAQTMFILPPSFAELERRLRGRAADDAAQIARRLVTAREEIAEYPLYRYVMINDDVEVTTRSMVAVIDACRHRRERMLPSIEEILASFPSV